MSKAIEDMLEEVRYETHLKCAVNMLKRGELTLEEIAKYSGLPLEKVRELAEETPADPS